VPGWPSLQSLARYDALTRAERLAVGRAVADALGPRFRPATELVGQAELAAIELLQEGKEPTPFAVIPGGKFKMGVRPEEHDELAGFVEDDEAALFELEEKLRAAAPVHSVSVKPFLMATHLLTVDIARSRSAPIAALEVDRGRIGKIDAPVHLYPTEIASVLAGSPRFRLPCEAEWEWVAREGGAKQWIVDPYEWINYDWTEEANAFGVHLRQTSSGSPTNGSRITNARQPSPSHVVVGCPVSFVVSIADGSRSSRCWSLRAAIASMEMRNIATACAL
jgi:formylglycine-generating enzyme required for sulfatase activity